VLKQQNTAADTGVPAGLGALEPYIRLGNTFESTRPVLAYYARLRAVEMGLTPPLKGANDAYCLSILDKIEADKKKLTEQGNDSMLSQAVAYQRVVGVASEFYKQAEAEMKSGAAQAKTGNKYSQAALVFGVAMSISAAEAGSDGIAGRKAQAEKLAAYVNECVQHHRPIVYDMHNAGGGGGGSGGGGPDTRSVAAAVSPAAAQPQAPAPGARTTLGPVPAGLEPISRFMALAEKVQSSSPVLALFARIAAADRGLQPDLRSPTNDPYTILVMNLVEENKKGLKAAGQDSSAGKGHAEAVRFANHYFGTADAQMGHGLRGTAAQNMAAQFRMAAVILEVAESIRSHPEVAAKLQAAKAAEAHITACLSRGGAVTPLAVAPPPAAATAFPDALGKTPLTHGVVSPPPTPSPTHAVAPAQLGGLGASSGGGGGGGGDNSGGASSSSLPDLKEPVPPPQDPATLVQPTAPPPQQVGTVAQPSGPSGGLGWVPRGRAGCLPYVPKNKDDIEYENVQAAKKAIDEAVRHIKSSDNAGAVRMLSKALANLIV
jgi:hypothetical protein